MSQQFLRLLPQGSAAGMQPSHLTDPNAFTTEDKTELIDNFYATSDNSLSTGVWECAPCREVNESYPVHEMVSVISGSVTLTDADGNAETFTAGDFFFIPKGAYCIWENTETMRKFFMSAV